MDSPAKISCLNCSADLGTPNNDLSAFYTLNCSSRVRSPSSPAVVELIPIHHALATVFNLDTLARVSMSMGNVNDNVNVNGRTKDPLKDFQSKASTVPICFSCYLVLSDLYRSYTEFSQLRKANSLLASKLKELENQLKSNLQNHNLDQNHNKNQEQTRLQSLLQEQSEHQPEDLEKDCENDAVSNLLTCIDDQHGLSESPDRNQNELNADTELDFKDRVLENESDSEDRLAAVEFVKAEVNNDSDSGSDVDEIEINRMENSNGRTEEGMRRDKHLQESCDTEEPSEPVDVDQLSSSIPKNSSTFNGDRESGENSAATVTPEGVDILTKLRAKTEGPSSSFSFLNSSRNSGPDCVSVLRESIHLEEMDQEGQFQLKTLAVAQKKRKRVLYSSEGLRVDVLTTQNCNSVAISPSFAQLEPVTGPSSLAPDLEFGIQNLPESFFWDCDSCAFDDESEVDEIESSSEEMEEEGDDEHLDDSLEQSKESPSMVWLGHQEFLEPKRKRLSRRLKRKKIYDEEGFDNVLPVVGKTCRGKDIIWYDGYEYVATRKEKGGSIGYTCRQVRTLNCPGKLSWYPDEKRKRPILFMYHVGHKPSAMAPIVSTEPCRKVKNPQRRIPKPNPNRNLNPNPCVLMEKLPSPTIPEPRARIYKHHATFESIKDAETFVKNDDNAVWRKAGSDPVVNGYKHRYKCKPYGLVCPARIYIFARKGEGGDKFEIWLTTDKHTHLSCSIEKNLECSTHSFLIVKGLYNSGITKTEHIRRKLREMNIKLSPSVIKKCVRHIAE